jgi:putative ABC transport system substrate-binding protein
VKRRDFLAAALASPLLARAQPGRLRKIGILVPAPGYPDRYEALRAGLRDLGWVEGRNLAIEWRYAEGKYEHLTELTAELVKAGVELIVTNSTSATSAARKATSTVPIVAAAIGDPVVSGLAASLSRPGGNVTGVSIIFDSIGPKMLELAFTVLPKLARPALLGNAQGGGSPFYKALVRELQALAAKAGASPMTLSASTAPELEAALATSVRERAEALLVMVEPFMVSQRRRIAEFALEHRLPAFGQSAEFVEAAFLASFGPDFRAAFRRSASHVDRILKGARAGELPVEQTTALELAINLKTARALGLTLPRNVLLRADRVIE